MDFLNKAIKKDRKICCCCCCLILTELFRFFNHLIFLYHNLCYFLFCSLKSINFQIDCHYAHLIKSIKKDETPFSLTSWFFFLLSLLSLSYQSFIYRKLNRHFFLRTRASLNILKSARKDEIINKFYKFCWNYIFIKYQKKKLIAFHFNDNMTC